MTQLTASEAAKQYSPRPIFDVRKIAQNILRRRLWFIAFIIIDIILINGILNDPILKETWDFVIPGIGITIQITIISFVFALVIGLVTAFGRLSRNFIVYNIATFYVELFRGLPLLVIILIFTFVITPFATDVISGTPDTVDEAGNITAYGLPGIPFLDDALQRIVGISEEVIPTTTIRTRDIDPIWRIMMAFALTYGAFMSEVFRAGIESIGKGQSEAARSLGMSYVQSMRYIILPQAIRNVLPALANNFILLLKDTSLASAVAVPEISHLTRQYSANRFRYPQGLLVLSFLYANVTIILSMGVNILERKLQADRRED